MGVISHHTEKSWDLLLTPLQELTQMLLQSPRPIP